MKKILIANRGEIAVRIIRACKQMGIDTVAVYSTADKQALHTQLAQEAICIGGPSVQESYLNMQAILSAALLTGCDGIHPGFGFLSENSKFARMVQQCGLVFIGPDPDIIDMMGDKASARKTMIAAGVPVVPGSDGIINTLEEAVLIADKIGYPVLIKASNGGGGRGMRVAMSADELDLAYNSAKAEAKAAFGDEDVYMEKYVLEPKHIEVQIAADHFGNVLHFYERDCSLQRRNQKMIEEAPCITLNETTRNRIIEAAVNACKAVGYNSVGTVEFIQSQEGEFYFIEMNTRLQVEHTVSEDLCQLDLVKLQIRSASNLEFKLKQEEIIPMGHVMECRVNAENIRKNFMPSAGIIKFVHFPGGKDVRIDSAVYNGCEIPPYYDSMIAKIIVRGENRLECIRRMRCALEECLVEGIETNIEFLYLLLHNKTVLEAKANTATIQHFIEELKENGTVI